MAAVSRIMEILIPWVGPALAEPLYPVAERIGVRFAGYTSLQSPEEIRDFTRDLIHDAVSSVTSGSFLVFPAPGLKVKMDPDDFDTIADDILYLLFETFPADEKHLRLLEAYAEQTGSLSALRAIYVSFASLLPRGEIATLKKVILGYPAFRLYWMRGGADGGFPS